MSSLILIHGGAHGSWCWAPMVEPLRAAGCHVQAVDLPGRDGTAAGGSTVTFSDWVDTVSAAVDAAPSPPFLIAHSMGGLSASQVAERRPDDLAGIVYLSAVVPPDGGNGLTELQGAGPDCALLAEGAMTFSADSTTITVTPEAARLAFYGRCPDSAVTAALARLCSESVAPMATPLSLGAGFAAVPKIYLGCTDDRAATPAFQRLQAERCGAEFRSLESDHSPFFSAPHTLLAMLLDATDVRR